MSHCQAVDIDQKSTSFATRYIKKSRIVFPPEQSKIFGFVMNQLKENYQIFISHIEEYAFAVVFCLMFIAIIEMNARILSIGSPTRIITTTIVLLTLYLIFKLS